MITDIRQRRIATTANFYVRVTRFLGVSLIAAAL